MVDRLNKPQLNLDSVAEWEAWLAADPDPGGVFLRLRKKGSTQPGITYAEALDVALCFGWIDGQSRALDADYFLQTFTPRRARSLWSKVNIGHVTRLIDEGRMRPQGQQEIDRAKADGRWDSAYRQSDREIPPGAAGGAGCEPRDREGIRRADCAEPVRDGVPCRQSQAARFPGGPCRRVRGDAQTRRDTSLIAGDQALRAAGPR